MRAADLLIMKRVSTGEADLVIRPEKRGESIGPFMGITGCGWEKQSGRSVAR